MDKNKVNLFTETGSSDPVDDILICEVCEKNEARGVYGSSCGPVSFAYCEDCLDKGAEPYGTILAYLSTVVETSIDLKPERKRIASYYQNIIDESLEVAGKTREEFYTDIDKAIQQLNDLMNKWYREQAEKTKENISKYDLNPDDFTVVDIDKYADNMNDQQYLYQGKRFYVVPNNISDKVVSVYQDFTHTGVTFYDSEDNELLKTVGIGYDDLVTPTAFSIEDLTTIENNLWEPEEEE